MTDAARSHQQEATNGDELVALVAPDGSVVGEAPRSRVRSENLRHSATAILVRNAVGDIFVHRRSSSKDWCPSAHDAAAGGVLRSGEDPARSARRELAEELGIDTADLTLLGIAPYEDSTVRVVEHVFETIWSGSVDFVDGEVVWGRWMSLEELGRHLTDPTWVFVPDTRRLLRRLAADRVHDYQRLNTPV